MNVYYWTIIMQWYLNEVKRPACALGCLLCFEIYERQYKGRLVPMLS